MLVVLAVPCVLFAQDDGRRFVDAALLVGAAKIPATSSGVITESSPSSFAWQINAGVHIYRVGPASILVEFPFTIVPSQNKVTAVPFITSRPTGNLNTYLFTPGLRFQFQHLRFSPYVAVGAGMERATVLNTVQLDSVNVFSSAQARNTRGVGDFGGGLDARLTRNLSLRGEFRDFCRDQRICQPIQT
jgi:hypothetical protein